MYKTNYVILFLAYLELTFEPNNFSEWTYQNVYLLLKQIC